MTEDRAAVMATNGPHTVRDIYLNGNGLCDNGHSLALSVPFHSVFNSFATSLHGRSGLWRG